MDGCLAFTRVFSPSQLGTKYVTESALTGWDLTGISCTSGGATVLIGKIGRAPCRERATAGDDPGDDKVKVTVAAGDTPTCTFTNTKHASLTISKSSLGGTATFSYTTSGTCLSN